MPKLFSDASASDDPGRDRNEQARRAQQARTSRRAEGAAIGERGTRWHSGGRARFEGGGGVEVEEGGEVKVSGGNLELTSTDGDVGLVFFGNVQDGSRAWFFAFKDGATAIGLAGSQSQSFWFMRDNSGNQLLSNDAATGVGLARPYLQMWLTPSFGAEQDGTSFWPSTSSGTATKLMQGINPIWNPRLTIGVAMAGAGGTGHWRLDIGGTTVIADETSGGPHTVEIPGWGGSIGPGDAVGIDLYGWVTDGPGRVFLQVDRLHGTQS